jgi:DNA-binding CsgD family transcriptional regulator
MQISLEEFSRVIAAIHAAAESPERWPEAYSAVARLVDSSAAQPDADRAWEKLLDSDVMEADRAVRPRCEPSVKRLMALLEPHFKTAKQVQMRLADELPGRLALASLDRLAVAAFVVDGAGAVHHLNASARTLLAELDCARVENSRFRFSKPAFNAAFEAALHGATQSPPRSSLLPLSCGRKEICEVTVSPLHADHASACLVPLALVVIARPRADGERIRILQRVRRLYGLTDAEARGMAALSLGETVEEIALAHGVRTSTVRAQVRSIFEKTGVHRQSDLVRIALSGAPLLAGPDRWL